MLTQKKKIIDNGIFYTPERIAEELLLGGLPFIKHVKTLRILDPSCGEGALLKAASQIFNKSTRLFGCDLFSPENSDEAFSWHFTEGDFFDYTTEEKFDLICTNPPYIQYGRMDKLQRDDLHAKFSQTVAISKRSDIWVYFLIKSIEHLKINGMIGAILPWSFLEAEFAQPFRMWLSEKFESIQILVLKDKHFDTTEKRVLLLWLSGYGKSANAITFSFSDHIEKKHKYRQVSIDTWKQKNILSEIGFSTTQLLSKAREYGFDTFSNYASVSIGIVTGANDFFIRTLEDINKLNIPIETCTPIITKIADMKGLCSTKINNKFLLKFDCGNKKIVDYINNGVKLEFHTRSHCERRTKRKLKWYEVDEGTVPDAFFTYRVSEIPFMSLNCNRVQCTNAIHKIVFNKKVPINTQKWIAISLLSTVSQLSLEHSGRHYGSGALKIEPSSLKNALVIVPQQKVSRKRFNKISKLLEIDKRQAMLEATQYIKEVTGMSKIFLTNVKKTLDGIKKQRL